MNTYEVYIYTETGERDADGIDYKGSCTVVEFDNWEDAEQYANDNGATLICGTGDDWDDYKKCWFCGEWKPTSEMNKDDLCEHCEMYLKSRGEI